MNTLSLSPGTTVVTGALGSGITTTLNHLGADALTAGRPVLILDPFRNGRGYEDLASAPGVTLVTDLAAASEAVRGILDQIKAELDGVHGVTPKEHPVILVDRYAGIELNHMILSALIEKLARDAGTAVTVALGVSLASAWVNMPVHTLVELAHGDRTEVQGLWPADSAEEAGAVAAELRAAERPGHAVTQHAGGSVQAVRVPALASQAEEPRPF